MSISSTHNHFINSTSGNLSEVREQLEEVHKFLVEQCEKKLPSRSGNNMKWGIEMKRVSIALPEDKRPSLIKKDKERFSEVVNMLATLERLIDALKWFEKSKDFGKLQVKVCNPATSSALGDNDLILVDESSQIKVRCEVCDIVSENDSNKKELKELHSLGCSEWPVAEEEKARFASDGERRFMVVSPEFAQGIQEKGRKWKTKNYIYKPQDLLDGSNGAVILEVLNSLTSP